MKIYESIHLDQEKLLVITVRHLRYNFIEIIAKYETPFKWQKKTYLLNFIVNIQTYFVCRCDICNINIDKLADLCFFERRDEFAIELFI